MNQNESNLKSSLPNNLTLSFLTTSWILGPQENKEQSIYFSGCKVATINYHRLEFVKHVSLPVPFDLQLSMIRENLIPCDFSSLMPKWSTQDGKILLSGRLFFDWLDGFDVTKIDKFKFESGQLLLIYHLQINDMEKKRVRILWKNPAGDYVLCNANNETLLCRGSMLSLIDSILSIQRQTWSIQQCRKFVSSSL